MPPEPPAEPEVPSSEVWDQLGPVQVTAESPTVREMAAPSLEAVTVWVSPSQTMSSWAKPRAWKVVTAGRKERPSFSTGAASVKVTGSPFTSREKSPCSAARDGVHSRAASTPPHRMGRRIFFIAVHPPFEVGARRAGAGEPPAKISNIAIPEHIVAHSDRKVKRERSLFVWEAQKERGSADCRGREAEKTAVQGKDRGQLQKIF